MKRGQFDQDSSYVRILGRRSHRHLALGTKSECWVLTSKSFNNGDACLYKRAVVLDYTPGDLTVRVKLQETDTVMTMPVEYVLEAEDHYLQDDAAEMKVLNYPNVLENIRLRFQKASDPSEEFRKMIYTYAGWVLFALNPYQACDNLYSDLECEKYYRKTITQEKPHPFALASTAFDRLISDRKSQYILISGESGGGKTECSKHVLKYLTWVTRRQRRQRGRMSVGGPGDAAESLATLLIKASPLLEFFGNAKTARNVNSSRFGKLFQLRYDSPGEKLCSAHLFTYLLAKSRVVQVPAGEENYHVFHSLVHGVDSETRKALYMTADFTSPFLGQDWIPNSHVPYSYRDNGPFNLPTLLAIMEEFGIDDHEASSILKLLASILHLGNIKFEEIENSVEGGARIVNPEMCVIVCKLLGFPLEASDQLEAVLTSRRIRDTRSRLNVDKCRNTVFSLCKGIYELLFFWVVQMVREKLEQEESRYDISAAADETCIGVLDLFGFENMEPGSRNGFEQLCINYANEQLHYHFMTEVIERELEIYTSEGIIVKPKALFSDLSSLMNQDVLLLLLGVKGQHPGVFSLLEDVTKLGGSDRDRNFCRRANQLISTHAKSSTGGSPTKRRRNLTMQTNTTVDVQFKIDHFAEPVVYTTDGFSDRNQDYMSDEIKQFLGTCEETAFLRKLLVLPCEDQKSTTRSMCGVFVKQMTSLMSTLDQTSCHFIRCLKPNDIQAAFLFDDNRVLKQLVTGGVGPVLEIMKEGFPCRLTYDALWARFKDYLPEKVQRQLTPRDFADLTLSYLHVNPASYSLGTTRVFFRFGVLQLFQKIMQEMTADQMAEFAVQVHKHQMVIKLVRCVCAIMVGSKLAARARQLKHKRVAKEAALAFTTFWLPRRQEQAALKIQHYFLSIPERFYFFTARRYVIYIQRFYRRHLVLRRALEASVWETKLHACKCIRALLIRLHLKKRAALSREYWAAVKIQSIWRGVSCRRFVLEQIKRHCALQILYAWRRSKLRRHLRRLFEGRTAAPIPIPPSPTQYSASRGVKRCLHRTSMVYQETRTFWEISSVNPSVTSDNIVGEVRRRRRSVFCQAPVPSPKVGAAVAEAVSPLARAPLVDDQASPNFGAYYSPVDLDPPPLQLEPPIVIEEPHTRTAKQHTRTVDTRTVDTRTVDTRSVDTRSVDPHMRTVDPHMRTVDTSHTRTVDPHTLHHRVTAARLSVADLSGPDMGNRQSCCVTAPDSQPPKFEQTTTADSSTLSPEVVFRSEPPLRGQNNPIVGSRLSIKAWRKGIEKELAQADEPSSPRNSLRPSFSCSVLTPGWKPPADCPEPDWTEKMPSSSVESGATPLFGSRRVKPVVAEKENTPRPRQLFCLPRKPVPSSKMPIMPVSGTSHKGVAVSTKIPSKPHAQVTVIKIKNHHLQ